MQINAIARWLISGMAVKDVAEAFQLTTVRVNQIRKEVVESKQSRKT